MIIQENGIIIEGNFKKTFLEQRLAIIGHRNCTKPEQDRAYALGYLMVKKGYWVVSGLAIGIDYYGMTGAIQACMDGHSGGVIGVVPTLYPKVYPTSNKHLYDLTKQYGYLLYPSGDQVPTSPLYTLKARNSGKYFDVRPLLPDRSILNGELCSQVHFVCDTPYVTGGSRYALQKAKDLGRDIYQWSSDGKYIKDVTIRGKVDTNEVIYDIKSIESIINLSEVCGGKV